jgi:hypothetical protein
MADPIVSTTGPSVTTRWIALLSLAGVTLIAATASYLHALTVVQAADGTTIVSFFIPAMADLVIASGSANLVYATRSGVPLPRLSMVSVALGVVVTFTANVASGSPHAIHPWLVNAWPPLAFVLSLESLVGFGRRSRIIQEQAAEAARLLCTHTVGVNLAEAVANALDHATECLAEEVSHREVARRFDIDHRRVRGLVDSVRPAPTAEPEDTDELVSIPA